MPEYEDLSQIINVDDVEAFVSFIEDAHKYGRLNIYCQYPKTPITPEFILINACAFDAIKCASALLNGETPLSVNLHLPVFGLYPLHYAADNLTPSFTELFLYHGAGTDVLSVSDEPDFLRKLPLNIALWRLRKTYNIPFYTAKAYVFKLLTSLCLPSTRYALETVGMLAWASKETVSEFLVYARSKNLAALAVLLTVAREMVSDAVMQIREFYKQHYSLIPECSRGLEEPMFLLFDVYEKAGDVIEAYVKKEKKDEINRDEAIEEFTCLLCEAGFPLKRSDTDLFDYDWFLQVQDRRLFKAHQERRNKTDFLWYPGDTGMPHYSKSGFRWTGVDNLSNASMPQKKEFKTDPALVKTILDTNRILYAPPPKRPWLPNLLKFSSKKPRGLLASALLHLRGRV